MVNNGTQIDQNWTAQQYLEKRLEQQQKYHSDKSRRSQTKYKWIRRIEIITAGLIPVLAILPKETPYIQLIIGMVGALVAILAGILALDNYQQQWIEHRATSEALKAERMLFLTRCGDYGDKENEQLRLCKLVENVEAILANEHNKWQQQRQKRLVNTESKAVV